MSTSISAADSGLTARPDTFRRFQMKVDDDVEQGEKTAVIKQAVISDAKLGKPSYDTANKCWKIALPDDLDVNEFKKLQIQVGADGFKMTSYSDWMKVPIS